MIKKNNLTIAIYGIADTERLSYPVYTHDHNLSVYSNGRLLHYLHLERITRRKYDNRLDEFLYDFLKSKGLLQVDPNVIFVDNVVGRSFYSFKGDIRFEVPNNEGLNAGVEAGVLRWLGEQKKAYVLSHELSHVYSCVPFFGNFKENSLLVHFDAGASKSNFSAWKYSGDKLQLIEYHWDLKWITSFFNANPLSFALTNGNVKNQNSVPGKLMGLAAYGTYKPELEEWLLDNDYLNKYWGKKKVLVEKINRDWNMKMTDIRPKSEFLQHVVATMHHIYIRETVNKISSLQHKTNAKYLYFTGGSALNICLNRQLLSSKLFREVYVPPCTNDSGLSLGAGAFFELISKKTVSAISPYCHAWGIENCKTEIQDSEINAIADLIYKGNILAICNGFAEAGPRALGNRSIVARADNKELSTTISMTMKKREWYRPVAPVMLKENAMYFTGLERFPAISKYMLTEFDVLNEKLPEIRGAVHVDGTSRIQVLFREEDNPFLWRLLKVLHQKYNIRALINTSFNEAGEPLVHTREDAIRAVKKMGIDYLVFNGFLQHF